MKHLKVYGWQGSRIECRPAPNGSTQTREVVAAPSKAAAARAAGYERPAQMFCLCETGNARERALAMGKPGTVFWCPIDDSYRSECEWTEAAP